MISQKQIEIQEIEEKIIFLKKEYVTASNEFDKYHGKNWNVNWTYGTFTAEEKQKVSEKIESNYRKLIKLDPLRFNKSLDILAKIWRNS